LLRVDQRRSQAEYDSGADRLPNGKRYFFAIHSLHHFPQERYYKSNTVVRLAASTANINPRQISSATKTPCISSYRNKFVAISVPLPSNQPNP
jgi:hypothetical protein